MLLTCPTVATTLDPCPRRPILTSSSLLQREQGSTCEPLPRSHVWGGICTELTPRSQYWHTATPCQEMGTASCCSPVGGSCSSARFCLLWGGTILKDVTKAPPAMEARGLPAAPLNTKTGGHKRIQAAGGGFPHHPWTLQGQDAVGDEVSHGSRQIQGRKSPPATHMSSIPLDGNALHVLQQR